MGTHTYALVEVSASTYQEIKKILEEAGYHHAIDEKFNVIDMHGLALRLDLTPSAVGN